MEANSVAERVEIKFSNLFNVLKPANFSNDTYNKLTDKIYAAFKDVYLNNNGYDWYLKADDDTFIFEDNLRLFVSDKNSNDPVTFGFHFKISGGYQSGGAGYLLSKEAMNRLGYKLATNNTFCPNSGLEDVDTGACLKSLNVLPKNSTDEKGRERFHVTTLANHYDNITVDWLNTYAANPLRAVNKN